MVLWTAITIGFILILGFVGGTMVHFLRGALDSEDAIRVDPDIKKEDV